MASRPSILLIEDSPGECELFRLALGQAGVNVSFNKEPDADAAFHYLENIQMGEALPSLILLDLKLCGQNGCELLRRLRADARLAHIPVVMLTTSDDPRDLHACHVNGANGYVVKPGTFQDLVTFAHDLCGYWLKWNRAEVPCSC